MFDWKINIVTRSVLHRTVVKDLPYYTYFSTALGGPWEAEWPSYKIEAALHRLSDEELKACLFYQPVLADVIGQVLKEREHVR
jgi:hypothetical protein